MQCIRFFLTLLDDIDLMSEEHYDYDAKKTKKLNDERESHNKKLQWSQLCG